MPTIDGGWLDQRQRFPPPGPQASQKQPKQPVSWAKAFLRTSEDTQLVMQGEGLEQEVSTRRPTRSDRSTRPDDGLHFLVECRPATPTSMGFLAGRNIGEAHVTLPRILPPLENLLDLFARHRASIGFIFSARRVARRWSASSACHRREPPRLVEEVEDPRHVRRAGRRGGARRHHHAIAGEVQIRTTMIRPSGTRYSSSSSAAKVCFADTPANEGINQIRTSASVRSRSGRLVT
jgi:hypothetical protein